MTEGSAVWSVGFHSGRRGDLLAVLEIVQHEWTRHDGLDPRLDLNNSMIAALSKARPNFRARDHRLYTRLSHEQLSVFAAALSTYLAGQDRTMRDEATPWLALMLSNVRRKTENLVERIAGLDRAQFSGAGAPNGPYIDLDEGAPPPWKQR